MWNSNLNIEAEKSTFLLYVMSDSRSKVKKFKRFADGNFTLL